MSLSQFLAPWATAIICRPTRGVFYARSLARTLRAGMIRIGIQHDVAAFGKVKRCLVSKPYVVRRRAAGLRPNRRPARPPRSGGLFAHWAWVARPTTAW